MDPLTSVALLVVVAAVVLYALYWVIRKAVGSGIRDARSPIDPTRRPDSGTETPMHR